MAEYHMHMELAAKISYVQKPSRINIDYTRLILLLIYMVNRAVTALRRLHVTQCFFCSLPFSESFEAQLVATADMD